VGGQIWLLSAAISLCLAWGAAAAQERSAEAQADAPASEVGTGGDDANPWRVDVYYENDTRYRGEDATGESVGLSKFRNTIQIEADKEFESGWGFHGVFRGSYDGVYDMNSDEYGYDAGGPITLQSTISKSAGIIVDLPHGCAPGTPCVTHDVAAGPPLFLATNAFLNPDQMLATNPNDGMRVLGDRWHRINKKYSGVEFGVPVRPCNADNRGCRDFGEYGDLDMTQLRFAEFNDRLDFIREFYFKRLFDAGNDDQLFVKLGRQQVVWGRTDLFRVLDVLNPVDYSRNNIYDELQDIRIPMWMLQTEYRMGGTEHLQDANVQLVWNFDKFRPNNLGQCGTPNVILDAGCFFRGMVNLWDNGGTVANFAHLPDALSSQIGLPPDAWLATNFGPNQIGIRRVVMPDWSISNTQVGLKFEGVSAGGLAFSLNALSYRSQLPSIHAFNNGSVNPFTGGTTNPIPLPQPDGSVVAPPYGYLIAFDMHFPRVTLLGGSMDFQVEKAKAAVRIEAAYTDGEEFANTLETKLYSENNVFRSVVGIDRPTVIPFISGTRAVLFSGQIFYQHIFDHEVQKSYYGDVGMPDWEDNAIFTLLTRATYLNARLNPQLIMAYDLGANTAVFAPSVQWLISDDLQLSFGANFKQKWDDVSDWAFDDCRSCNPFPPFTTYSDQGQPFTPGSWGLGGIEPLGRFRAGPIGAAWKENEIFLTLRYKF
jgi:hypothetical protein